MARWLAFTVWVLIVMFLCGIVLHLIESVPVSLLWVNYCVWELERWPFLCLSFTVSAGHMVSSKMLDSSLCAAYREAGHCTASFAAAATLCSPCLHSLTLMSKKVVQVQRMQSRVNKLCSWTDWSDKAGGSLRMAEVRPWKPSLFSTQGQRCANLKVASSFLCWNFTTNNHWPK